MLGALNGASQALAQAARSALQRRRVFQVLAYNAVRRAEFRWWQAALLAYVALLWRSMNKAEINFKGLSYRKLVVAVHVGLLKYLAKKASSGAVLLQSVKAAPQYAADALQDLIQVRVEEFLDSQMDSLGEKTKSLLKDPYMPIAVQGTVEDFVDVLLPDLKLALFTKTEEMMGSYGYRQAELQRAHAVHRAKAAIAAAEHKQHRSRRGSRSASSRNLLAGVAPAPPGGSPRSAESSGSAASAARAEQEAERQAAEDDEIDSVLDALQDEGGDLDDSVLLDDDWSSSDEDEDEDSSDDSADEDDMFHFRDLCIGTPKLGSSSGGVGNGAASLRKGLVAARSGTSSTGAGAGGAGVSPSPSPSPSSSSRTRRKKRRKGTRGDAVADTGKCAALRRWASSGRQRAAGAFKTGLRAVRALRPHKVVGAVRFRFLRLRAHVLYTSSPFDRSFWRSIRNPQYWLMQGVGLVPGVGMVWWLFMFVLHDKRDEYQLSQFLVGFQTAKFFSQGCFNLLRGALTYYLCATRDVPCCDTHGPMMGRTLDVFFFLIQILVVWLTFFMLPDTEPCRSVDDPHHAFLLDENRQDRKQAALRAKVRLGRGGRLAGLFWWDTFFVVLVLALFAVAFFGLEQRDWQLRTTCYFLNVLYGLAALPFVPFKVPVMGQLLTPTKATGYTREGSTVIRVIAPPPQAVLRFQDRELKQRQFARRRLSSPGADILGPGGLPGAPGAAPPSPYLNGAQRAYKGGGAAAGGAAPAASGTSSGGHPASAGVAAALNSSSAPRGGGPAWLSSSSASSLLARRNSSGSGPSAAAGALLATVPEGSEEDEAAGSAHQQGEPGAEVEASSHGEGNPYTRMGFFLQDTFEAESFRRELGLDAEDSGGEMGAQSAREPSTRFKRRVSEVARETALSNSRSSAQALLARRASTADLGP